MKKKLLLPLLLSIVFISIALPVYAQTPNSSETPQPEVTGAITGVIVNQSPGGSVPKSATVMLHVLDENYSQLGMLHAESQPDGTFRFEDVPLSPEMFYVGFVTYQGASYNSLPIPFDGKNTLNIELPIYDTTNDLAMAQVDEMHVLFNFAEDGLEVNEIYLISNLGELTITGTLTLTDGQPATIEFPLPADADYVFFKPEDDTRFVKLDDSFVDTAPIVPGNQVTNFMVSYLVPFSEGMSYSYTAPLAINNIDFLIPAEQGVSLEGQNLSGPELTTLQDQSVYQVYSYKGLSRDQTVQFSFLGKPNIGGGDTNQSITKPGAAKKNLAIEIGSGVAGIAMISIGIWQWRKSRQVEVEDDIEDESDNSDFSQVAAEIARLDDAYGRGEVDDEEYNQLRAELVKQAKLLLMKVDK